MSGRAGAVGRAWRRKGERSAVALGCLLASLGACSSGGGGTSSGSGDGRGISSGSGDGKSSGDGRGTSSGSGDGRGTSSGSGDGRGTSSGSDGVVAADLALTPNGFFAAGPPTLVIGTLGDERADRSVAAQAELVRDLFPGARVVLDTSIDVEAGPAGWPPNPVLFGNRDVNRVVERLGPALPLAIGRDGLALGGERWTEVGARVIAVIPGRASAAGPAYPTFVLYAGTGSPGIVDINATRHGAEPILIADAFGRLLTGRWERGPLGDAQARLEPPARRIAWRMLDRTVAGVTMRVGFPAQLPATPDDDAVADAVQRGLARAASRLKLEPGALVAITVYVAPDRRSKTSLTGDGGDGHAVAIAHALHVIRRDPAPGGPFEGLVAHEGAHVLAGAAWGAVASPMLGEGLAVWVAGGYGGRTLAELAARREPRPLASSLLAPREFRARPEAETYPVAGWLITAAIEQVGFERVRDHLLSASPAGWAAACEAAGTTAEALDLAVRALHSSHR